MPTAVSGWREITLTTPFLYTGGALEISVNFDISQGVSPWTTAGFSWKKDNATGRTLSYVGSTAPLTTLPNLRTVRAQLQITHISGSPCTQSTYSWLSYCQSVNNLCRFQFYIRSYWKYCWLRAIVSMAKVALL
ncbi:MAG: hypothetical protein IPP29_22925 [Bacteroidetes bacterium]|nr:hypothetical protein [Bacteroidota bacterium]